MFFLQQTSPKKAATACTQNENEIALTYFHGSRSHRFAFFRAVWFQFKTAFYVAVFGVIVLCCFGSLAGYNSSSSSLRDRFVFFRVYFIEAFSVSFTLKASSWARNEMEMEGDVF